MILENPALSPRPVRPALCICCGRTKVWDGAVRLASSLEDQLADGEAQVDDEEGATNLRHVNAPAQQPSSEEVEKHRVDDHLP